MSSQACCKFEWKVDESQKNENTEERNKQIKRCVTHLQAEFNHQVLMNQKVEIEWSKESIKMNEMITMHG